MLFRSDDFIPRVKFKMKHQEFLPYKFMKTSSMFKVHNQVQFNLQFIEWIFTSKEKLSTKEFVFDPGGFMDLPTL